MKHFFAGMAIGAAIAVTGALEADVQDRKTAALWCACVEADWTDDGVSACDERFDPDQQFAYEEDCREQDD